MFKFVLFLVARIVKRLRMVAINDAPYTFINNELLDKDTGLCHDGFLCSVPRKRTSHNQTLVFIYFQVFKFHPRVRLPWKTDISHFIFHVLAIRVRHITYIGVRLYPHGISFL